MSLFECTKCHCVENTTTCNYWIDSDRDGKDPLCSECDPKIGKWHGIFNKNPAKGMMIGEDGFLYHKSHVEAGDVHHCKMVGEVGL